MTIGTSLFVIALGAILRYAVTGQVPGIDLQTAGDPDVGRGRGPGHRACPPGAKPVRGRAAAGYDLMRDGPAQRGEQAVSPPAES
jgi:hypothetical protein